MKPRISQPGGVCYLEDYYKIKNVSKHDQFNLENYDSLFVETKVLKRLENKYNSLARKLIVNNTLTFSDAEELTDFIILLKLRNPYWLNDTLEKNKNSWIDNIFKEAFDDVEQEFPFLQITQDKKKAIVQLFSELNKNDKDFSKKVQLFSLIQRDIIPDRNFLFRRVLIECEWTLLETPSVGPYFITSDNPGFSTTSKDNLIYNTRFIEDFHFYFPVSFRYCLLIRGMFKDFSYSRRSLKSVLKKTVSRRDVVAINDKTIQLINKLVIGCDDWYLTKVAEINNPHKKFH